jgi:cytochrome P450
MNNQLPNGPKLAPFKQFIKLFSNPAVFFTENRKQFGNTFTLRMPGKRTFVVITNPEAIKDIFQANQQQVLTGKPNSDMLKTTLGLNSLLTLDGKKHIAHRKILNAPFHGASIQAHSGIMLNEVNKVIDQLKPDTTIRLLPHMHKVTLGVILRAVFGVDDESRLSHLAHRLEKLLAFIKSKVGLMTMLLPWLHINLGKLTPWGRLQLILKEVNDGLYSEIELRRQVTDLSKRNDVLSLLLQATYDDGSKLSDLELRDEMLTMLNAGHETTATSLAWAMYRIHSHPEVLKKILAELKTVVGDGVNVTQEHVAKLEYLDAVVKETLRLLPIISFIVRQLEVPMTIDGYNLPAGTTVVPCIHLAHHREDYWPNPEKFDPERFLTTNVGPYNFLPFGGGIRRCIGASMAMYEMKIVLAQMLNRASFELLPDYVPTHVRQGVVVGPSHEMPIRVKSIKW